MEIPKSIVFATNKDTLKFSLYRYALCASTYTPRYQERYRLLHYGLVLFNAVKNVSIIRWLAISMFVYLNDYMIEVQWKKN